MDSLINNSEGELTFPGNFGINDNSIPFKIQLNDGAKMKVNGNLSLQSGAVFKMVNSSNELTQTTLEASNLTFLNIGRGQILDIGQNTIVKVSGANSRAYSIN